MFFVPCPRCGSPVEIAPDAIGPDRRNRNSVTQCDECDFVFHFDDAEVQAEPEVEGAL